MLRIFRGVFRFSSGGFTNLRIARRFWARAPREISAQMGRLFRFFRLFSTLGMRAPERNQFTPFPGSKPTGGAATCGENDNTRLYCKQKACLVEGMERGAHPPVFCK